MGPKRLRPAVKTATEGRIVDATVYTLRHSHASACHYATAPFHDLDALIAAARAPRGFHQGSTSADE